MTAHLCDLAIDMAEPLPTQRDADGEPTGPWTSIDYAESDAAIAEAARRIEAGMAERQS